MNKIESRIESLFVQQRLTNTCFKKIKTYRNYRRHE